MTEMPQPPAPVREGTEDPSLVKPLWERIFEATAVVVTLVCVWLLNRGEVAGMPVGVLGAGMYLVIFYRARLYSDTLLQIFYVTTHLIGWYLWGKEEELRERLLEGTTRVIFIAIALVVILLLGAGMKRWTRAALPYWDAATTILSIIAQLLMTYKYADTWGFWIAVNVICIGVYLKRRLWFTMLLYIILLGLAVNGLHTWVEKV